MKKYFLGKLLLQGCSRVIKFLFKNMNNKSNISNSSKKVTQKPQKTLCLKAKRKTIVLTIFNFTKKKIFNVLLTAIREKMKFASLKTEGFSQTKTESFDQIYNDMNGNEETSNLSIHSKQSNSTFRQYDESNLCSRRKNKNIIKVFWVEGMMHLPHLSLQHATL